MILGRVCPPGLWVRTAAHARPAHNALKPQAIARKRAFRKATHRFAPPATRKRTCLPRDKHYSGTARLWLVLSGGWARTHLRRRGASLRLAAHHVGGHPAICQPAPARACHAPSAGVTLARGKFPWSPRPYKLAVLPAAKEKKESSNARRRQRGGDRQASADEAAKDGGCATEEGAHRRRQRRRTCDSAPPNLCH